MSWCVAGLAVALMLLKTGTWLTVVRFEAPFALNIAYTAVTVLMVWSYVAAVAVAPMSRPPIVTRVAHVEDGHIGSDNATLLASGKGNSGNDPDDEQTTTRYCERCDMHKSVRVHHCSACQRCVYRMDHHCPWTNNCVGYDNKKFFLLFLFYTSTSCLLFSAMASALVWRNPQPLADDVASNSNSNSNTTQLVQFTYGLSLVIGCVLAGYLLFHLWLLQRGLTTFEFLVGQRGELAHMPLSYNVRVYFGNNVAMWWLPVAPALDTNMRGTSH